MNFHISYECTEIITEIKQDIAEFGADEPAWGVLIERQVKVPFQDKPLRANVLVNYLMGEQPPTEDELEGGTAHLSTLGELLLVFEDENKII